MMDERLEKAYAFSNFKIARNVEKQLMHDKFQEQLTYSVNGGVFIVDMQLINFVTTFEENSNLILLDINQNPILINDVKEFKTKISSIYFEALNDYYMKYSEYKTKRNVKSLIED